MLRGWAEHAAAAALGAGVAVWQVLAIQKGPAWPPLDLALMRGSGYGALALLCLTLMLGPLARLWPRVLGRALPARRATGVWCTVLAALHAWFALRYVGWGHNATLRDVFFTRRTPYYQSDSFFSVPRIQDPEWVPDLTPTGVALWLGMAALAYLLVLAATSNNFAEQWLGTSSWKWLHRGAHTAFVLVICHFALVTLAPLKQSPYRDIRFWYLVAATALLQAAGFARTVWLRHRARLDRPVGPPPAGSAGLVRN